MRILFINSEIQSMPSILYALQRMKHDVRMYKEAIEDIGGRPEKEKALLSYLKKEQIEVVISVLFAPIAAKQTHELSIPYAVYGMDSPMYATYLPVFPRYDNVFLFYFDKNEYQRVKSLGHQNVYHLPLAGDTEWADGISMSKTDIDRYACDISFVGSLYTKNAYDDSLPKIPERFQNIFSKILEQGAFLWDGKDRVEQFLSPELIHIVRSLCPEIFECLYECPESYYLKSLFFDRKMTQVERTLLLQLLAENHDLRLYTWDSEKVPDGVKRYPSVDVMTESRKVFRASKINLNITLRSITSGVPARVFDIMSTGGFVLSNWQEEIPELFEEGKEIATFRTPEELLEKTDYYLTHEEERKQIGINARRKIREYYTYEHQLKKIISILFPLP